MRFPWLNPRAWPLTIRVPLLVAGLMILVGIIGAAAMEVANAIDDANQGWKIT